jgi:hypothetical protein
MTAFYLRKFTGLIFNSRPQPLSIFRLFCFTVGIAFVSVPQSFGQIPGNVYTYVDGIYLLDSGIVGGYGSVTEEYTGMGHDDAVTVTVVSPSGRTASYSSGWMSGSASGSAWLDVDTEDGLYDIFLAYSRYCRIGDLLDENQSGGQEQQYAKPWVQILAISFDPNPVKSGSQAKVQVQIRGSNSLNGKSGTMEIVAGLLTDILDPGLPNPRTEGYTVSANPIGTSGEFIVKPVLSVGKSTGTITYLVAFFSVPTVPPPSGQQPGTDIKGESPKQSPVLTVNSTTQ